MSQGTADILICVSVLEHTVQWVNDYLPLVKNCI